MELYIITGDETQSLTDGTVCTLLAQDGVGLPPLHRLTERGPQQHGETDRGHRLDPRIITLMLSVQGDSTWTKRGTLARMFRPSNTPAILKWVRPDSSVRQIKVHHVRDLTFFSDVRSKYSMRIPVRVVCPDPLFYDPELQHQNFELAAGGQTMDVPLVIPWKVGVSTLDVATPVINSGTYKTFPIITIEGPITDCKITNESTGEFIDFDGQTIGNGDTWTIDLRYGEKTVLDQNENKKMPTSDSDIATWHLGVDPDVPDGINSIRVEGSACNAATSIEIDYYVMYVSL